MPEEVPSLKVMSYFADLSIGHQYLRRGDIFVVDEPIAGWLTTGWFCCLYNVTVLGWCAVWFNLFVFWQLLGVIKSSTLFVEFRTDFPENTFAVLADIIKIRNLRNLYQPKKHARGSLESSFSIIEINVKIRRRFYSYSYVFCENLWEVFFILFALIASFLAKTGEGRELFSFSNFLLRYCLIRIKRSLFNFSYWPSTNFFFSSCPSHLS